MRVSVFGIGYVGVVSCGCLAELGHEVVGVDISAEKIAMLAAGRSPIVEDEIDTLIANAVQQGKLTTTIDVMDAVHSFTRARNRNNGRLAEPPEKSI